MKRIALWVGLAVLAYPLFFAAGCEKQVKDVAKTSEVNVEVDVAAIKALNDEFVQLYNAEDFERLMSVFYAENPIQMTPDVPVRRGKEAILLAYQEGSKSNIEHVDSSVVEDVRISGKLAVAWGIDTGTTTPRSGGELAPYNLKWLVVFERQPDGAWKCIYEMRNDNPLAEQKSPSVEQDLMALEKGWNNALVKKDWAFLDKILADDWMATNQDGIFYSKAQYLAYLRSGGELTSSSAADDFMVRVYGDAAVVTFRFIDEAQSSGKDTGGQSRITDTWVKRVGHWQCVAEHKTRIATK
jgi:ketosteroid isomerase-like protein